LYQSPRPRPFSNLYTDEWSVGKPGRRLLKGVPMSIALLLLGLLLAAVGGERFVRGAVGLATWLRIPAGVVGATVAAFATSSPELTVGVLSALDNRSELALGDATGSNMVNLGVVLGFTLLFGSLRVQRREVQREIIGFIAALAVLLVSSIDGRIAQTESISMIAIFVLWLTWVVRDAKKSRQAVHDLAETRKGLILVELVLGLVLLMVSGRLIVVAAKDIGEVLGWSPFIMGSIVVAIGTSAPELVTTIVSARRGHVGVGIGTVLGSNIFNSMLIVGTAGWISPIEISVLPTLIAVLVSLAATLAVIPSKSGELGRKSGLVLTLLYVFFVSALLIAQ